MNLPNHLSTITHWILVGPLGPTLTMKAPGVLAVDGGIKFAPDADFWIGDGDSAPDCKLPDHSFKLPPAKDFSDFKGALQLLKGVQTLDLWGFLGGRRDHELAVLGECHHFLKTRPQCRINLYEDGKIVGVFVPEGSGEIQYKGGFSLLSLEESRPTLTGDILYALPEPINLTPLSSHGISNKSQGIIRYQSNSPLLFLFGDF